MRLLTVLACGSKQDRGLVYSPPQAMPRAMLRIPLVRLLPVLCAALVSQLTMAAQPQRTPIDVSKLGPQVGDRVPDFKLKDQNGETWTLQSVMGPQGAMLVFYRSADW